MLKKRIWIIILIILILLAIAGFLTYDSYNFPTYTPPSYDNYVCPDSGEWINCMPALNKSEAKYCSWVGDNCPNANIAY